MGKKKSESAPAKPKLAVSDINIGLPPRALIILAVLALVLYGGAAGLFFWQQGQGRDAAVRQTQANAAALAQRVSGRMKAYQKALVEAAADPQLAALFVAKDEAGLRGQEEAIASKVPDALHIRLLPAGWDLTNASGDSHLGFAALEIARSAERSAKPSLIEVHRFGSVHEHIALAVPVAGADGKTVVGVIHGAFPLKRVQQALDAAGDYEGKWVVRQVTGGKPVLLAQRGRAESAGGQKDGAEPVGGTLWELVYWRAAQATDWLQYGLYFGVPALVLVLLWLGMQVQARRSGQVGRPDVVTLYKVEDVLDVAEKKQQVPPTFAKAKGLSGVLSRLKRHKRADADAKADVDVDSTATPAGETEAITPPPVVPTLSGVVVEDTDVPLAPEIGAAPVSAPAAAEPLPAEIFRAYDIRGLVGETLTRHGVYELGRAIGSAAYDKGEQTVIVARDGRLSGEELMSALSSGLQESGRDVVDLGVVPTPVLYFATHFLGSNSGVMLTGSHNPPEYNGLKIVLNGEALAGQALRNLGQRVASGDLLQGEGGRQEQNLIPDYVKRISGDVKLSRPLKVVVDCGNGVAGVVAPALLRALSCEVIELFCEVDGKFPNHHPDPGKPENLADLIRQVQEQGADIGVAFDGDGDRLGVVDSGGKIIWPDRVLMLLAADVLSRHPGADILYDVKSTRNLAGEILARGGSPMMCQTGHSLVKAKLKEIGALLAGEMSGHIYFKERWYGFDDGLYACARLLEVLAADSRNTAEVFADLPEAVSTPELNMPVPEGTQFSLVQKVLNQGQFPAEAKLVTIDGLRVELEEGWGLVRPSNTTPSVVFRFEADNEAGLEKIKDLFRQQLLQIDPQLALPF